MLYIVMEQHGTQRNGVALIDVVLIVFGQQWSLVFALSKGFVDKQMFLLKPCCTSFSCKMPLVFFYSF